MKKVLNIILILCIMVMTVSMPSFALDRTVETDGTEIRPYFDYINVMMNAFDIDSNGKAMIDAALTAMGADKVKLEIELQQYDVKTYSWKTLKTWSRTEEGEDVILGGTRYVMKGYLYRAIINGYVYKNGKVVEEHQMISRKIYYE